MTHDDLLTKIDNVTYAHDNGHTIDKDRIVKQLNALLAMVELHKPKHFIGDDEIYCACSLSPLIAYPCPSIQAIEKELK